MPIDAIAFERDEQMIFAETQRDSHFVDMSNPPALQVSADSPDHLKESESAERPPPAGAMFGVRRASRAPPTSPRATAKPVESMKALDWFWNVVSGNPALQESVRRSRLLLFGISKRQTDAEKEWMITPWERIDLPPGEFRAGGPLGLNARCCVLRQVLGAPGSRRARWPSWRLRVLVIVVDPADIIVRYVAESLAHTLDAQRLNVSASYLTVETAADANTFRERSGSAGSSPVRGYPARSIPRLQLEKELLRRYDVVHVIGHGAVAHDCGQAGIQLGQEQPLQAGALARLLAGKNFRLAVFNVCNASRPDAVVDFGRTSIMEGVSDFVVAPAEPQHCKHAATFNDALYQALATGDSIPSAVTKGRIAIMQDLSPRAAVDWYVKVLAPSYSADSSLARSSPSSTSPGGEEERIGGRSGWMGPRSVASTESDEAEWWLPILYTRHTIHDRALHRRVVQPLRFFASLLFAALFLAGGCVAANDANDRAVVVPARHLAQDGAIWLSFDGRSFGIDEHEVTVGEYEECVRRGRCRRPPAAASLEDARAMGMNFGDPDRTYHPMNYVTAVEADRYCAQRHGRLPSSDEFRLAAGGSSGFLPGATARRFCWGNSPEPSCSEGIGAVHMRNAKGGGCGDSATAAVTDPRYEGSRTPEGVWGLCGNVWEWLADLEGADRKNAGGGYWNDEVNKFVTHNTESDPPETRDPEIGFRCAYDTPSDIRATLANQHGDTVRKGP